MESLRRMKNAGAQAAGSSSGRELVMMMERRTITIPLSSCGLLSRDGFPPGIGVVGSSLVLPTPRCSRVCVRE